MDYEEQLKLDQVIATEVEKAIIVHRALFTMIISTFSLLLFWGNADKLDPLLMILLAVNAFWGGFIYFRGGKDKFPFKLDNLSDSMPIFSGLAVIGLCYVIAVIS